MAAYRKGILWDFVNIDLMWKKKKKWKIKVLRCIYEGAGTLCWYKNRNTFNKIKKTKEQNISWFMFSCIRYIIH